VKPPRKKTLVEAAELLHELGDLMLAHPEIHSPLVDILGEDDAETFLRALIELRHLHAVPIKTRTAGRDPLADELLERGRRLIKEWPGPVEPYFKRGSPTVPGNAFTQWFCDKMWPVSVANCRTVLRRIYKESWAREIPSKNA
jgi:hypothetical protein